MKTINIAYPYNNRLHNNVFPLYIIDSEYETGEYVQIFCYGINLGRHQIVGVREVYLRKLTDYDCYLAFGYNKKDVRLLFKQHYPATDFTIKKITRLLLRKAYYDGCYGPSGYVKPILNMAKKLAKFPIQ